MATPAEGNSKSVLVRSAVGATGPFPHADPAAERLASPWGRPEMF
jgi:hypothetical protein